MKTQWLFCTLFLYSSIPLHSETLAQWTFNGPPLAPALNQETWLATIGWGTAQPVPPSALYPDVGETSVNDDFSWGLYEFAEQGTRNKSAGAMIAVSTVGYRNVRLSWKQSQEAGSSRYWRLQYSTDGTTFNDAVAFETETSEQFVPRQASFSNVPGVNDNEQFVVRWVAEFSSTVTGSGLAGYIPVGPGPYRPHAAVRFDDIRMEADPLDAGVQLSLASVPAQTALENTPTSPLILSPNSTRPDLRWQMRTADEDLLSPSKIHVGWNGAAWSLTMRPEEDRSGSTVVSLYASDAGGRHARVNFGIEVVATNLPPQLQSIPNQTCRRGAALEPIPLHVFDPEGRPIRFSASCSDASLARRFDFIQGDTETFLRIVPSLDQSGSATVSVVASEQRHKVETKFVLTVLPSEASQLCETFGYEDGSLVDHSRNLWQSVEPLSEIIDGSLRLVGTVERKLPGVFQANDTTDLTLYTAFTLTCVGKPQTVPFMHYNHDVGVACLFLMGSGAAPGYFRVGLANAELQATVSSQDLEIGHPARIVTAYASRSGQSWFWVNPFEHPTAMTAMDPATQSAVDCLVLHDGIRAGLIKIDDLLVTTSREEAFEVPVPNLRVTATDGGLEISWPDSPLDYALQYRENLAMPWQTNPGFAALSEGRRVVRFFNAQGGRFCRLIRR